MTLSRMEQQQEQILGQGYTHKKFNCGYLHKKLGRRLRQREPVNIENFAQPQAEPIKLAKQAKDIFRPYALDESNTSRKRRVSRSADEEALKENSTTDPKTTHTAPTTAKEQTRCQPKNEPLHINTAVSCPTTITSAESYYLPLLSPHSHNMHLEKQRAALYMRYMTQVQSENYFASNLQTVMNYSMGYSHIAAAPIFNGC